VGELRMGESCQLPSAYLTQPWKIAHL
jgi:hypothetical protein